MDLVLPPDPASLSLASALHNKSDLGTQRPVFFERGRREKKHNQGFVMTSCTNWVGLARAYSLPDSLVQFLSKSKILSLDDCKNLVREICSRNTSKFVDLAIYLTWLPRLNSTRSQRCRAPQCSSCARVKWTPFTNLPRAVSSPLASSSGVGLFKFWLQLQC